MKIAILTFFESENYGTVLQAYATQKYLESLGYSVELLHIKRAVSGGSSHYVQKASKPMFVEKIRYKITSILQEKNIRKKSEEFQAFRDEYLRVSTFYASEEALKKELGEYDLFVSGGDQIWNPYHKVFSLHYMFDFLPDNKPRISYGSSFGVARIEEETILADMQAQLRKYRAIAVREESGVNLIEKMGLQATQVVDPVFLVKEEWNNFVGKSPKKRKYCLVYALIGYPQEEMRKIRAFAKKRKLDVVILPYNRKNCLNGFEKAFGLSPKEFLNYIANAEHVFTNSFHGLAFSLLFEKQFTLLGCDSAEGDAKRVRLIEMLQQLGVEDQGFEMREKVNYQKTKQILECRIQDSKKYITDAIENREE